MGLNVDLTQMIGAPDTLQCPKCKRRVKTFFSDYDIQCGDPNPKMGRWDLRMYCDNCDHDWKWSVEVTSTESSNLMEAAGKLEAAQKAAQQAQWDAAETSAVVLNCTCDDFCDDPCPRHARENALQDQVLKYKGQIKRLIKAVGKVVNVHTVDQAEQAISQLIEDARKYRLDQAGIDRRDVGAVELVELRARTAELLRERDEARAALHRLLKMLNEHGLLKRGLHPAQVDKTLAERAARYDEWLRFEERSGWTLKEFCREKDPMAEMQRLRAMFDTTRHHVLNALGEDDLGKSWSWIESRLLLLAEK